PFSCAVAHPIILVWILLVCAAHKETGIANIEIRTVHPLNPVGLRVEVIDGYGGYISYRGCQPVTCTSFPAAAQVIPPQKIQGVPPKIITIVGPVRFHGNHACAHVADAAAEL